MKCCVVTLGCQMNQSDSERIRSVIEKMGYEMTEVEEEASLIGVVDELRKNQDPNFEGGER